MKRSMYIPALLRVCAGYLLLLLGACTHVEPWERGVLARPDMATDPAPLQSQVRRHIYNSREAAATAVGTGGGGGCGCY
jgi:hypothetical protein